MEPCRACPHGTRSSPQRDHLPVDAPAGLGQVPCASGLPRARVPACADRTVTRWWHHVGAHAPRRTARTDPGRMASRRRRSSRIGATRGNNRRDRAPRRWVVRGRPRNPHAFPVITDLGRVPPGVAADEPAGRVRPGSPTRSGFRSTTHSRIRLHRRSRRPSGPVEPTLRWSHPRG